MEIKVCRLAAERATGEDLERVTQAYRVMTEAYNGGEIPHLLDLEFHAAIYAAAHNEYFKQLIESIALVFFRAWPSEYGVDEAYRDTFPWHGDLYRAVLARDAETAIDAIRKIIARDDEAVREILLRQEA